MQDKPSPLISGDPLKSLVDFSRKWFDLFGLVVFQHIANIIIFKWSNEYGKSSLLFKEFTPVQRNQTFFIFVVLALVISLIGSNTNNDPLAILIFFAMVAATFTFFVKSSVKKFINSQKKNLSNIFSHWELSKEYFEFSNDSSLVDNDYDYKGLYDNAHKKIKSYLESDTDNNPPLEAIGIMLKDSHRSYHRGEMRYGKINLKKDLDTINKL